ncbi:MAG: 30S ribosomal protein S2 [Patescibacteria group bacterium]
MNTSFQGKNQEEITKEIEEMYIAGVHFGYSSSSRHPKVKPYLFGSRNNTEIFNLEKVNSSLLEAEAFLKELGSRGSKFLLVSTKPEARDIIEKVGRELEIPFAVERWLGGTLTNLNEIKKRIAYFEDLHNKKISGEYKDHTKKEISQMDKKFAKMEGRFEGLRLHSGMPAALVVVDPKQEKTAVDEAKRMKIPVVAILNSDCDPTTVNYPIPANDASISSVQYLLGRLAEAYQEGKKHPVEKEVEKKEENSNN